jgi:5-methylcytosine-specific restriction endonuclease McrA
MLDKIIKYIIRLIRPSLTQKVKYDSKLEYKKIRKKALGSKNGARKKAFLVKIMDEVGDYKCHYCEQRDLVIKHQNDPDIPSYRRLTIDHVLSIKRGANPRDVSNWVIACERCNMKKGSRK